MIGRLTALVVAAIFCAAAMAAPKIEAVVVKPSPAQFAGDKAPQVEIAVSVNRTKFDKGGCDARLDFGDGEGRNLDFGVAVKRTVHHAYTKDGSYTITVRGAGATPCEGSQEAALKVAGQPKKSEPKKKAAKKDQKKKGAAK